MQQKQEFVRLAMQEGANRRELCRRFAIHPSTAYKWLARAAAGQDLAERSRRPHSSPGRSEAALEEQVLKLREAYPAWGARKLCKLLEREGIQAPAVSTVHEILRRGGCIVPPAGGSPATTRFEAAAPNLLWQMDFKGWRQLGDGTRCHPLTVIDDHSRFVPCLQACADQQSRTVQGHLQRTFERYGLPEAIFVDNGSPWGGSGGEPGRRQWTAMRVWLLKLGIRTIYSRPYHPQGRGKNERFHKTMDVEIFDLVRFANLAQLQHRFDRWRDTYNCERPHEGLGLAVPADRYRVSSRPMPKTLPQPQYDARDIVRRVSSTKAYVSFKGRFWSVPKAFRGEHLAIRPTNRDGRYGVFFAAHRIATIDLTKPKSVGHLPEQVSPMSPV